MQWIVQLIFRHRTISSLFLTSALSLWMLSAGADSQHRIARSLTMSVFFPFQFTFAQLTRARNIFAENRRLKEEITLLRTSNSFLKEQAIENERLRALLSFKENHPYELLPARVIAREPVQPYKSLIVNAGAKENVRMYMPVVSKDGVVGKVILPLEHLSLVQVLQDPSARMSVMTQNSRAVGILETANGQTFFIRYRTHEQVAKGDTVITSGLGGIFPRGMHVAVVEKIVEGSDPLFKKAFVRTCADFGHLEELFIIKLSPQWTVFLDEIDSLKQAQ